MKMKEMTGWGVFYEQELQAAFADWNDAEKFRDQMLAQYPDWVKKLEEDRWTVKDITITYQTT